MLTTTDIAQVLSHYDLGTLQSATPSRCGNVNETAFVQTAVSRFAIRRNNRRASEAALRYRHQLIARLGKAGFPSPDLIPTRDGDTLLMLDGRAFEVMSFLPGDPFHASHPQQIINAGATLAGYHTLTRGMPAPPAAAQFRYSPQEVMALNETLIRRDIMGDLSAMLSWYDARASHLRVQLSDSKYEALPHLPIHGDIHQGNFLFVNDRVSALLDYDQVAWDSPVADLTDALVAFASVDKSMVINWGVFAGPLDLERAELLLRGYASKATLSPQEIAALPVMLEIHWLHGEMSRVFSTSEGDPDYHLSVLNQGYQLVQWLDQHRDQINQQWKDILSGKTFSHIAVATAA